MPTITNLTRCVIYIGAFTDSFRWHISIQHSVDKEFEMSRKVLAAKRKGLVQKAVKGNRPNATRAVTDDEEDKLFKSGQFGISCPEALQRTM